MKISRLKDFILLKLYDFYDLKIYPKFIRLRIKFKRPRKGNISEEGVRKFNEVLNKYAEE